MQKKERLDVIYAVFCVLLQKNSNTKIGYYGTEKGPPEGFKAIARKESV